MSNTTIVYQGQSFLNKVIESTGEIENAFEIAILNGISITDDLVIGSELKTISPTNKEIVNNFSNKKIATNYNYELLQELTGIGFMKIEKNFKIG